jgi:hypothetical protein
MTVRNASYSLVITALAFGSMGGDCGLPSKNDCSMTVDVSCDPNTACVNGVRKTGSFWCQNHKWVCGVVACGSDAGTCDGPCSDAGSD